VIPLFVITAGIDRGIPVLVRSYRERCPLTASESCRPGAGASVAQYACERSRDESVRPQWRQHGRRRHENEPTRASVNGDTDVRLASGCDLNKARRASRRQDQLASAGAHRFHGAHTTVDTLTRADGWPSRRRHRSLESASLSTA
jgi:hypothetical protein